MNPSDKAAALKTKMNWNGRNGENEAYTASATAKRHPAGVMFGNSIRWMSDMMLEVKFATFQQKFYLF